MHSRRKHSCSASCLLPLLLLSGITRGCWAWSGGAAAAPEYMSTGQRCLFVPATADSEKPPLILLGGMAQTIASWEHHIPGLARNRDLLIYECLGQGPVDPNEQEVQDLFRNVSLPFQAQQLRDTIHEVFPESSCVDVVGFSLGGRVAMAMLAATAASTTDVPPPTTIRRLHLTGVAAGRSEYGEMAIVSWKDLLRMGNISGFGWSALLATYSPSFLKSNQDRLPAWVEYIVQSNSAEGLRALVEQTYYGDTSPWHTLNMAQRICSSAVTRKTKGRLVVGGMDSMAPLVDAKRLCQELGFQMGRAFENCGHAVPMEEPRAWRQDVLAFLDEEEQTK